MINFSLARTSISALVLQSRRRRRESIAHEAQDSWQHVQVYLQGCQLFAEDEGTSTALQRHLLRSTATSLLDWLLHYQVQTAAHACTSVSCLLFRSRLLLTADSTCQRAGLLDESCSCNVVLGYYLQLPFVH